MKISFWETPTVFGDPDDSGKLVAVFDVELDDGARIRMMRLWKIEDRFRVECGPDHQVEMSKDTKARILDMAVHEHKVRTTKL